jgi:hypothetical protein
VNAEYDLIGTLVLVLGRLRIIDGDGDDYYSYVFMSCLNDTLKEKNDET